MNVAVDVTRAYGQPAPGAGRDTVVVVRSTSNTEAWERALFAALTVRGFSVRSPDPAPVNPDESEALEEAEAIYQRLQPAEALEAVDRLIERAERTGSANLSREELVRLHLLGALCASALNQTDREIAFIDQAIRIAPAYVPPATNFPPSLREIYAERQQVPRPTTELRIEGLPDDAVVYVDGARSERNADLPSGRHLIRTEAPGYTTTGTTVVSSGDVTSVALALEYDPESVFREASGSTHDPRALARAAEIAGVDVMLLHVAGDRDRLRATLVSANGTIARWSGSRVANPDVVVAFLVDRFDAPARTRSAVRLESDESGAALWPWAVGGAVAAGIAAIVLVVVLSDSSPDQFDATWTLGE